MTRAARHAGQRNGRQDPRSRTVPRPSAPRACGGARNASTRFRDFHIRSCSLGRGRMIAEKHFARYSCAIPSDEDAVSRRRMEPGR
jgi:hypothetical protein